MKLPINQSGDLIEVTECQVLVVLRNFFLMNHEEWEALSSAVWSGQPNELMPAFMKTVKRQKEEKR